MLSIGVAIAIINPTTTTAPSTAGSRLKLRNRAFLQPLAASHPKSSSSVQLDTLRVLEWDKLCHSVASFATTPLGRDATKAQLWSLDQTYEDSMRLLQETNAAVEIQKHGGCSLDFTSVNILLVKSAIKHVRRVQPVDGVEALAIAGLLQLVDILQLNIRAAIKEDSDWYKRFMPLTEVILELVANRSLIKSIQQVVDEDGYVKDSASPALRRARDQVQSLEAKLFQLMDALIRKEKEEAISMEVSNINGRWCLQSQSVQNPTVQGLLLSSGSGAGSIVEPLVAVPLNDELQQARASVVRAEDEVLLSLSEKVSLSHLNFPMCSSSSFPDHCDCIILQIQSDIDDIETLLTSIVKLDMINARALHSLTFGGSCPDLILPRGSNVSDTAEGQLSRDNGPLKSSSVKRNWTLFLPKAFHPLMVQKHHQNLKDAKKNLNNANTEIRRIKLEGGNMYRREVRDIDLPSLQMEVAKLEEAAPVPVDIFIACETRVLVITGPNTGGKTICLKTVGLAAMMAKSGLYILSSEPARIPWFDFVFADIGDEQSLSQSLSTFSGHLKQISDIQSHATCQSLVLLDEVGAGTNPLEGAALGMALLESFAETGVLLTIATTHHGELKTLKYSNNSFENACMEFDEVNLKPTYKILWGVPGRSNAINIAERLGLPETVVNNARELYGISSAEINEVIVDMEKFKQEYQTSINKGRHYLMLSKELHEKLLVARRSILQHHVVLMQKKMQEISNAASLARSIINNKVRQVRSSASRSSQKPPINKEPSQAVTSNQLVADGAKKQFIFSGNAPFGEERNIKVPMVGDMVHVPSLGKKATVLRVDHSKQEIVVQSGNMKLKMKLDGIQV
ncbi:unnamed protein product [Rhodiola kirilowii]